MFRNNWCFWTFHLGVQGSVIGDEGNSLFCKGKWLVMLGTWCLWDLQYCCYNDMMRKSGDTVCFFSRCYPEFRVRAKTGSLGLSTLQGPCIPAGPIYLPSTQIPWPSPALEVQPWDCSGLTPVPVLGHSRSQELLSLEQVSRVWRTQYVQASCAETGHHCTTLSNGIRFNCRVNLGQVPRFQCLI